MLSDISCGHFFVQRRETSIVNRAARWALAVVAIAIMAPSQLQAASADKPMTVYFVDVEGGQATLFVTPEGGSLLIDTGFAGNDGRDADRIAAAAKDAGLQQIDLVLITHYHQDHVGGAPQLLDRIPIRAFIDHGPNRQADEPTTEHAFREYQNAISMRHVKRNIATVGEVLPVKGLHAEVVSSDGALIQTPLRGAGAPNPGCSSTTEKPTLDASENARSLGTMITFGAVRILDLGDLTWDKELELVCPFNKLGAVDIFVVSHHGLSASNSPALLSAVSPRIAVMDNGVNKGGAPSVWDTIKRSPRLEDLWQLHYSDEGGVKHNVEDNFIANLHGVDTGNYLKLSVWRDGNLELYNSRTAERRHYKTTQ
jgi:competence protein ComEC